MSQSDPPQEPLNNVALESAIFGLRMALTPEESIQARQHFLQTLVNSTLAVATTHPVPTAPDGGIPPDTDINMVVARNADGVEGVPCFTTLTALRGTLPQVENGIFMTGIQLAGILASSNYLLFVDGPELHAEVTTAEMQNIVSQAQLFMQAQQKAMERNERLEAMLSALDREDTDSNREAVTTAFVQEFARVPIAGPGDKETECIVLSMGDPAQPPASGGPPELELLTLDGALPCFTSAEAFTAWDSSERQAVVLPGAIIAQLAAQASVEMLVVNPAGPNKRTLRLEQDRVVVA
jgi:hypothetical protein